MIAETIARALGGAYCSAGRWRARCPAHDSTGATLAVRDANGGLEVRCFAGCSSTAVLNELRRRGLYDGKASKPSPAEAERQRESDARERAKRITAARWLWGETEPANWIIEDLSRQPDHSLPDTRDDPAAPRT